MSVAEIFETMTYGPAPESAGPALDWLSRHGRQFDLYIGNAWVAPKSGERFDSINPATATVLASVAQAGSEDVDAAVRAARTALPLWRDMPGHGRARYLYALARQVQKHSRLFAVLETLDNGKPIRETRDIDIPLVARHFAYHAGWAQLMEDEFRGFEPVGVVGQIIPWNFPLLMLAWKIAPALAMGNTVVLKPAEFTSLTALAFAEIVREIELPPGVINVITGDGRTGDALVRHPDVNKIAFTGSTEVGRGIRRATAGTGKRVSLELGGKSPFVVFDDADLDSSVEGIVDAIWFNQGQVCCAGSRLLMQESIAETLIKKVKARMETLRVGDPLDKAVDIGAIVAPVQLDRIRGLVDKGVAEGATLWQPTWACPTDGYFYPPTLFTNVAPATTIAQVEIFGPVLVSMTFRTPAEAVALANNTTYGLAASVWSENVSLALDVARRLKAGTVWVNCTNLFDAASGFGGYRESGFGREGGREGLYEYVKRTRASRGRPVMHAVDAVRSHARAATVEVRVQEAAPVQPETTPPQRRGASSEPDDEIPAGLVEYPLSGFDFTARLHDPTTSMPPIDRTPKLFIGGKQARPDAGYSILISGPSGRTVGEVGEGNRKDIRNAVEAAQSASGWASTTAYNRSQILYYLAENLSARFDEFACRIASMTGRPLDDHQAQPGTPQERCSARNEVELAIERLFTYGAWADKYDGRVAQTPLRGLTLAVPEPMGLIGILCPDSYPLLSLVSALAPAVAMGNTTVIAPSEAYPLSATDFYQVLETSDVPAGVVNIVTGKRDVLAPVLAAHDDVQSVWYFGPASGSKAVEVASAGNLKHVWTVSGADLEWANPAEGAGEEYLREATQMKNIWVPVGD